MARPLKPLIRGGGYYPSRRLTPLVYSGGYTTANGGGEPEPPDVYTEFSGSIVQFTAPKTHAFKSFSFTVDPVQDLHGQTSPYPAGGGKNILPPFVGTTANGLTSVVNSDGSITISGTASGTGGWITSGTVQFAKQIEIGTNYVIGVTTPLPQRLRVFLYNGTTSQEVVDINQGASSYGQAAENVYTGARLYLFTTANQAYNFTIYPQIEIGTLTATSYAPYSNICPISGWNSATVTGAGKNLLAKPFEYRPVPSRLSDCFFIKAGTYTFSFDSIGTATNWRIGVSMFDGNGNPLSDARYKPALNFDFVDSVKMWYMGGDTNKKSVTLTYIEDCFTRIWFGSGNTTSDMEASEPMLELSSTATAYEAPTINTLTLNFPSTVYGGNAVWNGDDTWTVTSEWERIDLGALTWSKYAQRFESGYLEAYQGTLNELTVICEAYRTFPNVNGGTFNADAVDGDMCFNASAGARSYLIVKNSQIETGADLKASLNGVYAICKLKTPTTITVTTETLFNALKGENNIWTDCGITTLEAIGEAIELNALQSLNILLGGRYVNNHTADDVSDEEALNIILGGNNT